MIRGFATQEQCTQLLERMDAIIDTWDPSTESSVFTTNRQTRTTDQYFLDSADKIHFFLESKAVGDDGQLRQVC